MLGPVVECGEIGGEALRLVPTQEHHLPPCVRWLNDPEVKRYLNSRFGLNQAGEEEWYRGVTSDPKTICWSIELGGRHIGQTGIDSLDWVVRTGVTGIFIGETDCWGRGVASAVMRHRATYAFVQLNLNALFTEIFTQNEGSLRAARAAGYREYGVRPYSGYREGEYLESWLGVLTRQEWEKRR